MPRPGLPESLDFVSLSQPIGLRGTGRSLLPRYPWMGGNHCQNSQSGYLMQPCYLCRVRTCNNITLTPRPWLKKILS